MAPVDNSTATALDYLFNHKPGEGSAAKAGGDVASAISDKIKAVETGPQAPFQSDVPKTPIVIEKASLVQ